MGKFGTFFKISTFWLKLDFKSRICPILCQSDPFQTQIWHTCLSDGDSHSRLPITLMTHTFFTFQSNVGNYYQWWWLFIMFVLDLDFSFEMFHFIQQGFTCTSMNNSISAEIQMLNSMSHWITRFPRILGKQRPVYTCDSVVRVMTYGLVREVCGEWRVLCALTLTNLSRLDLVKLVTFSSCVVISFL